MEYMHHKDKEVPEPRRPGEMANSKKSFLRVINTTFPHLLHFDTFCYAFPKGGHIQEAYRATVDGLETLMAKLANGNTVPGRLSSDQSLKDAEELVADMRKRFPIRGSNGVLHPEYGLLEVYLKDNQIKKLDDEMVNRLPHYTVFVVGGGKKVVKSNWAGQMLVNVNPVLNMMRVNFFDYNPRYSKDSIESKKPTEKFWEEVTKNMQLFETTRQLALQIPLKKISSVQLMADVDDASVGILEIGLIPPESELGEDKSVMFLQRFIATNMKHYNKMKERPSFLPFSFFDTEPYSLLIGGPVDELSDIQALLVTSEPRLKFQNRTGEGTTKQNLQTNKGNEKKSSSNNEGQANKGGKARVKISPTVKSRRKGILDILLKYKIISKEKYKEVLENPKKIVGRTRKPVNNCLGGLEDLELCFHDYINFRCKDVEELESRLSEPLESSEYGHDLEAESLGVNRRELVKMQSTTKNAKQLDAKASESDLVSNIKIGHFIALNRDDELFYSFCNGSIDQRMCYDHCRECLECFKWRYWHCSACNQCSYGVSIPSCEHCGRRKDDRDEVIRPLSVDGYRCDREGEYDEWQDCGMPVLTPFEWEDGGPPLDEEENVFTNEEFQAILTAAKGRDVIQWGGSCVEGQEEEAMQTTEADGGTKEELMEVTLEEKSGNVKRLISHENANGDMLEESKVKRKAVVVKMEEGENANDIVMKLSNEDIPMKEASRSVGNATLEVLLSDPLELMDQPSTILGPAYRRKASRLRGQKPRPSAEKAKEPERGNCVLQ